MKKLFITGGNGDIGSSISNIFEKNGYEVIRPSSVDFDLSNNDEIEKYCEHVNDVDVFIHCAGINYPKSFLKIDNFELREVMDINVNSFLHISRKLVPNMIKNKYGYILSISSLYGFISRKNRLLYSASKHSLNGMVKSMAIELGNHNIKVNSLSPGFVDTKITRKNNNNDKIKEWKNKIPLNRLAEPNDIADVAYFLCNNNKYITGQDIVVDGGYTVGGFEVD